MDSPGRRRPKSIPESTFSLDPARPSIALSDASSDACQLSSPRSRPQSKRLSLRVRDLLRQKKSTQAGSESPPPRPSCAFCVPIYQENQRWESCRLFLYRLDQCLDNQFCQVCKLLREALSGPGPPETEQYRKGLRSLDVTVESHIYGNCIGFLFGTEAERDALLLELPKVSLITTIMRGIRGNISSPQHQLPPSFPNISARSDSDAAFKTVKTWVKICDSDHYDCRRSVESKLPSRVLDVGTGKASKIKLVVTTGKEDAMYIALSHCWGSKHTFMTKSTDLAERCKGIEWSELPKTFQDAVTITRKLRVRYLWIDSLAILQDSESDWHFESAKMGEIYTNSYLTIAASLASNDQSGIFGSRLGVTQLAENGISVKWTPALNHLDPHTVDPLLTRSWAFQERILPTRYLSYGSQELKWHCKAAEHCECGFEWPEPTRDAPNEMLQAHRERRYHGLIVKAKALALDKLGAEARENYMMEATGAFLAVRQEVEDPDWDIDDEERLDLYDYWRDFVVPAYTRLALTVESDRLPALSAVASGIEKAIPDTYLAGLWRKDVRHGLAWSASVDAKMPAGYRGPSWSWVSVEGPITYWPLLREKSPTSENRWSSYRDTRSLRPSKPSLRVLKARCTPVSSNSTGAVSSGTLKLRGYTYSAVLEPTIRTRTRASEWHVSILVDSAIACLRHGTLLLDPGHMPSLGSSSTDTSTPEVLVTLLYLGEEYTKREETKSLNWRHNRPKEKQHATLKAYLVLLGSGRRRNTFVRIGLLRGASWPAGVTGARTEVTIQ